MGEKRILVVATGNAHKISEIASIFPEYEVLSQRECGFFDEAEENGLTFSENALIKARAACRALNLPVIADDSGICVNALNGKPGIYSARYAGLHGDDRANRQKLLSDLNGVTDRTAYFESAIALVRPDGEEMVANGRTYGHILTEEQGKGGFGYDCIFYSDDLKKSFGLATPEEKNSVSHRYRALTAMRERTGGKL